MLRIKQAKLNHNRVLRFQLVSIAISLLFTLSIANAKAAAHKISRVRLSVKPLDLTRPPTTEELMAAGQLGGLLYPTADIETEDTRSFLKKFFQIGMKSSDIARLEKNKDINLSFGRAIEAWNKHEYKKAVQLFRKHIEIYPESPWVSEAVLHIGCDARYNGRYSEAEEKFRWLIKTNQGSDHVGRKMLLNKARQRLAVLKVLQNNFEEADEHFRILKAESPDWRHRTYASHWLQRLSRYKAHKIAMLNCGVLALAELLQRDGKPREAAEVRQMRPDSFKGHSIEDLVYIATAYGYQLSGRRVPIDNLDKVPLPAIVQIDGRNSGDSGHYWIIEKFEADTLTIFDPQSGRRFDQHTKEFIREWNGIVIVFFDSETLPGEKLADHELGNIYGGCCGAPRPEDALGTPGNKAGPSANGPPPGGCGAPSWSVNMINMNLYVTDTPMWYRPPIGPPVNITVNYNSQSAIAYHEPFGNKWQFSYASYLVMDTSGTITVFMPDGRRDVYQPDGAGGYSHPYQVFNTLHKISNSRYELRFPDDTVYLYDVPSTGSSGSATAIQQSSSSAILPPTISYQSFLIEIRDAYGQKLILDYDDNIQLISITDAMGEVTTFTYNAEGLVTQVLDPFGRTAQFEYDANRNLTKITDMGGYWSTFSYDEDVYLSSIGNERGAWQFYIEPADGVVANSDDYPPPGDFMWQNHRITVTNPVGGVEEYFYYGGCDPDFRLCSGYSWYVSPTEYIPWKSRSENTYVSKVPKTRYFFESPGTLSQTTEIAKILYPTGESVEFTYDDDGNRTSVMDARGNTISMSYNHMGQITSIIYPNGQETILRYAENGVDLIEEENGLGIRRWTYNDKHAVTSAADRLNNTATYTYNPYGQVVLLTNQLGIEAQWEYDNLRRIAQITTNGQTWQHYTYDEIGRVKTQTEDTGMTYGFDYDDLNKLTQVTFPDQSKITYTFAGCCPHLLSSVTDRMGRTASFYYDDLKRLTKAVNPEKSVTQAQYDANGNIHKLIDPNGNPTTFFYDYNNRIIEKTYVDGTSTAYTYNDIGLLASITNARGIRTDFEYDENHNLVSIDYSDDTPGKTFTYDDYDRVIGRQDGIGTHSYTYDANSRIKSYDGPWLDDAITYDYDALGRRTGLQVQKGQSLVYVYDTLNRLTSIQSGARSFNYTHLNQSHYVTNLTRPNGSYTDYHYDVFNRLTELSNHNSSSALFNEYVYTYNSADLRTSEVVTNGILTAFSQNSQTRYFYNGLNQLLNAATPEKIYDYDVDGNMVLSHTPEGYEITTSFDAVNRLKSVQFQDDGGTLIRKEYYYNGEGFLAKTVEYANSVKVNEERYVRDGLLNLQERNADNNVVREYLWGLNLGGGIGGLLSVSISGQHFYYFYDGKGNVVLLTDDNQSAVVSYDYDAFGTLVQQVGTLEQPYLFSTKRYDEQTGLSYFGYRFFAPQLGRWMTRDPLGEFAGLNLYAFSRNNPVNIWDPTGLQTTSQGADAASRVGWNVGTTLAEEATKIPGAGPVISLMQMAPCMYHASNVVNERNRMLNELWPGARKKPLLQERNDALNSLPSPPRGTLGSDWAEILSGK